jgi:methionine synthase II (cobalamin-independent)
VTSQTRSTGIGSWPGHDLRTALETAFSDSPELPYLPELPDRGYHAGMVGRAAALLSGLAVDLQPSGWRLIDLPGSEQRRARSTLRADLDLLEEVAQGYSGVVKYSVAGPWTLAAMLQKTRGEPVVGDSGARRDICESLAEGLQQLTAEMARRLPETIPMLQLDEPMLPAVADGALRSASGLSRVSPVDRAELSAGLRRVVDLLPPEVSVVVHCCAAGLPWEAVRAAGVRGVFLDVDQLRSSDKDALGAAIEDGLLFGAGAVPAGSTLSAEAVARRVLTALPDADLGADLPGRVVVTPSCGLSGRTVADARAVMRAVRTAAGIVTDRLSR